MDFKYFFDPRSIAIIGASGTPGKVGYALLYNLIQGKERDIFPINPKEQELLGKQCFVSVGAVPEDIDLAVIAVRADIVPQVLRECGEKKIPFAIVISAGFKEVGDEGKKREEELKNIAQQYGIKLLGPNCLGAMDLQEDMNATFGVSVPPKGNIALLSQSGALGTAMLDWASQEGIGLSKFVSLGNEAALCELDFLEYLADDESTQAILMYLEQVQDGERFKTLLKEITKKKPVVVLKAGRSLRGTVAVKSHTGSLAAEDAVFEAVCRQSGVTIVHSLSELFDCAKLFHIGIMKPLDNLVVLTNGGGPSIVTTDLIEFSESLSLVDISEDVREKIKAVLPEMAATGNPIDILGDAPSSRYKDVLDILSVQENIDAIMVILTPQMMTEAVETAYVLAHYHAKKPIIPVFIGGRAVEEALNVFKEKRLINFDFPENAISALDALSPRKKEVVKTKGGATGVLAQMSFDEMDELLKVYDLHLAGTLMHDRDELIARAGEFDGKKTAMKIISPNIVHKTDQGAVRTHIEDKDELVLAWDEMVGRLHHENEGLIVEGALVQEMANGKEVIIGMKRDSVFGPIILFGMGGVFVEVYKDVSMRATPLDESIAREMIEEIKGHSILKGLRGQKPVDTEALVQIMLNISRLSIDHPEIKEIDLNPVFVNESGATVVDARFMR